MGPLYILVPTISITFEDEGLFPKAAEQQTARAIPIYNFILEDYMPEIKHISDIKSVSEGRRLCSLSKYNYAIMYIYKHIKPISNMF